MNGSVQSRAQRPLWEWLARSARVRGGVLLVVVASSTALVAIAPRHAPMSVLLVGISTAACAAISVLERRRPRLGLGPIVAAIAFVFAVAVITPPRTSNDLWSYTMYGRAVTVHSANPYSHPPADFASDPFLSRVSKIWRNRASVFGPAFIGLAVTGTALAGDSVLANRLFFQMVAMAAAAAALAIVWRRTRSPAALAWLGLHPVFGAIAINGGHIDVLIGLGILIAALLASRERGVMCGFVIGIVALMKLTSLLALVGVLLWAWRRRNSRLAAGAAIAAGTTVVLGYLPVVTSASRVLGTADRTVTLASIWNPLAEMLLGHDAGRRIAHPLAPNSTLTVVFFLSLGLVAALALLVGWRAAANRRPEPAVGAATAAYTIAAEYSYPWYSSWALPTLSAHRPSRLAWVVWLQASLMLAAMKLPIVPSGSVPSSLARGVLSYVAPVVLLVAFVMTGLRGDTRSPAHEIGS